MFCPNLFPYLLHWRLSAVILYRKKKALHTRPQPGKLWGPGIGRRQGTKLGIRAHPAPPPPSKDQSPQKKAGEWCIGLGARCHPAPLCTLGHLGPRVPPALPTQGVERVRHGLCIQGKAQDHHPPPPHSSVGSREPGSLVTCAQNSGQHRSQPTSSPSKPGQAESPWFGSQVQVQSVPGSRVIWSEAKISLDARPAAPRW